MSATVYLNETIGGLLSQGVAATVASQPADPVEFLAEWLLRWEECWALPLLCAAIKC
jgi:hypothetical protein